MKVVVYKCDFCGTVLSDKSQGIAKKHISITLEPESGWVAQEKRTWQFKAALYGIHQFCDSKCLAGTFNQLKHNI